MLKPRIIAKVEVRSVHSDRMESYDTIDNVELRDWLAKCRTAVCVCDDLRLQEIWFGASVDAVSFKVVSLVESVEGKLRSIVPVQGDTVVARNSFDSRLIGRFGKMVVGVVNLLDGFLAHE